MNSQAKDHIMINLHEQEKAMNEKREENERLIESVRRMKSEMNLMG